MSELFWTKDIKEKVKENLEIYYGDDELINKYFLSFIDDHLKEYFELRNADYKKKYGHLLKKFNSDIFRIFPKPDIQSCYYELKFDLTNLYEELKKSKSI
jgi:hypothetical protein